MENIFKEKAISADELSDLYRYTETRIKELSEKFDVVETLDEQDTHWKTGELLWEDAEHMIPLMKKKWGNVPKTPDDYTEEDYIRIATLKRVQKLLEKAM